MIWSENSVKVPLCEADVKRIELEIEETADDESEPDSVGEWAERAIRRELARCDQENRHPAKVRVDLPPEVAKRVDLRIESRKQRNGVEDEALL